MNCYETSLAVLSCLLLRIAVSFNSYSGQGKSPMYGDYEAQRHWMEITHNLPTMQWYNGSKDNDLQYWGLDYPPLTAYHSKLCGYVANMLNPDWVALHKSRGYESYYHKLFMRYTVFVADLFVYISSVIWFVVTVMENKPTNEQVVAAITILSYPGLILIDHGHFQYNCISLGFTLTSIVFMLKDRHELASLFFVSALNYKQMSLYHSFPYFFYLLAISYHQKSWISSFKKLASIGFTVILTFALCWLPFLSSLDSVLLVFGRLFPFNRGLFEDKVSNVWCTVSVVWKIKKYISQPRMVLLCLGSTVLSCVPPCVDLLLRGPSKRKFLYSLINCSLAFFLFSYQVHEKSILIVAMPVCLTILHTPLASTWFLLLSTFSMYPLLVRDGQAVSYFALIVLFFMVSSFRFSYRNYSAIVKLAFFVSVVGCIILHIGFALLEPPAKFPDLFSLLFSVYSCGHFVLFWLYFVYTQWTCPSYQRPIEQAGDLFKKPGTMKLKNN